jgi:hypothetical protein
MSSLPGARPELYFGWLVSPTYAVNGDEQRCLAIFSISHREAAFGGATQRYHGR